MKQAGQRWAEWVAARAWRGPVLVVVCLLPLISGVVSRLLRGSYWFADYEAVACAGQRLAAGLTIYDQAPVCEGMNPTGYVYLPWMAEAFHAAASVLGEDVWRAVYAALYIASFLLLGWVAFFLKRAPGGLWDRILVLGLVTGSTIYWGNVAPPIHALVAAAALVAARRPLLFALVLAAAAAVKPVFLTYGIVLLVLPIPIYRRLLLGALAAGLGLLPTVHFVLTGGELVARWTANIEHYVYHTQPGDGLLGWIAVLGGDPGSTWAQGIWLVFAGGVALAAVVLAECGGLGPDQRVWLGMGAGALANPRIVPLDVFLLANLLGAILVLSRTQTEASAQSSWPGRIAIGGVLAGVLGNSLDAGDYAPKIATLCLSIALFWLAARSLKMRSVAAS